MQEEGVELERVDIDRGEVLVRFIRTTHGFLELFKDELLESGLLTSISVHWLDRPDMRRHLFWGSLRDEATNAEVCEALVCALRKFFPGRYGAPVPAQL